MQTEDALACLAELLHSQDQISDKMWNFYLLLVDACLNNKEQITEVIEAAIVVLINFISKNPDQFRDLNLNGYGTCLQMMMEVISKLLQSAKNDQDEMKAMNPITLINSIVENVNGIDAFLPGIIQTLLGELSTANVPEYRCMLSQALCMCLWYNPASTLQSLDFSNACVPFVELVFQQQQSLTEDFELKRFVLGLTSLVKMDVQQVPASLHPYLQNILKSIVYLL